MKSIKPGRGPSLFSGIVGIFMIGFGIIWTIIAAQASPLFALFGLFWTGIAIAMTVYNFKNATGKNRYSSYDITDSREEPDPLNERFGESEAAPQASEASSRFCPFCGSAADESYRFCNRCGKKLP